MLENLFEKKSIGMSFIHFMLYITLRTMLFVKKSHELNLFLIKIRSLNKYFNHN